MQRLQSAEREEKFPNLDIATQFMLQGGPNLRRVQQKAVGPRHRPQSPGPRGRNGSEGGR